MDCGQDLAGAFSKCIPNRDILLDTKFGLHNGAPREGLEQALSKKEQIMYTPWFPQSQFRKAAMAGSALTSLMNLW